MSIRQIFLRFIKEPMPLAQKTSVFDYTYQVWRNEKLKTKVVEEKKVEPVGKDPATYEKRVSINEFEQKPVDKHHHQFKGLFFPNLKRFQYKK